MKEFLRFLKNTRIEFIATLVAAGVFFVGLPILLLHMYGSTEAGVTMVAPAYVVDFFWRVVRCIMVLFGVWALFRIWFPRMERHVDPDDKPLRDSYGKPVTFEIDWLNMGPTGRNVLTVIAILGLLTSITLLIVFP